MSKYKAQDALKPYKDELITTCPPTIGDHINTAYSPTPEKKKELEDLVTTTLEGELDTLLGPIQNILDKFEKLVNAKAKKGLQDQKQKQDSRKNGDKRGEQDAEVSQKIPEPEASDTKFSEPPTMPDADNSLSSDYPNSSGSIFENVGWLKMNKAQSYVEIVHKSGTMIKINQAGEVVIHAVGSVKQVIDGDLTMQVSGGLDISSGKGIYMHAPEIEIEADQKTTITSMEVELKDTMQVKADQAMLQVMTVKATAPISAPGYGMG